MEEQIIDQEVLHGHPEGKSVKQSGITKVLIISNILLFIAILVLYFLFYRQSGNNSNVKALNAAAYTKPGGLKIAFVNSDSIKTRYKLVKDLEGNLEKKYAQFDAEIAGKQKILQQKSQDLQQKYETKQISMEEAQRLDEQLKAEGQKLYQLNQDYSSRMSEEEARVNMVFIDSINNFLQRYNKKFGFDYILGYTKGGGILYAKDTLDITIDVIEGLNKEYKDKAPSGK
jgi:outer membrane protein